MKVQEFKEQLASVTPEAPAHFHARVERTLENLKEAQMKEPTKRNNRRARRHSTRAVVLAVLLAVMVCAVAVAATQWDLFTRLSFLTGSAPENADQLMQSTLYQETVNQVEITVREPGYDGRTLLVQYAYRMLDVEDSYGITAGEVFGDNLPEGMTAETLLEGISDEALEALEAHQVGWNLDQLWINGVGVNPPAGSGGVYQGSTTPGELIFTEYWRLDQAGIQLNGPTEITLPIGARIPAEERQTLFDRDTGLYRLPETGVLTFTYDAKELSGQVRTISIEEAKELPEVTARVAEAAFSPLMTYITLELQVNPDAMASYLQANGEGPRDADGNLLWAYGGMDVFDEWLCSLELVDGSGTLLFPDHAGLDGYSNDWAEFLYPYLSSMPPELYLAPILEGQADMTRAVLVKPVNQ